jgi:hypothetical protein
MPEETSFTIFINRHFSTQSSTVPTDDKNNKLAKTSKTNTEEEDVIDDVLFL